MTTHELEALAPLPMSSGTYWAATCSCNNPDGNGDGSAEFVGSDALDAVRAWQEHAAAQHDDIPEDGRRVTDVDGWAVMLADYTHKGERIVRLTIEVEPYGDRMAADLTPTDWDRLRGAL